VAAASVPAAAQCVAVAAGTVPAARVGKSFPIFVHCDDTSRHSGANTPVHCGQSRDRVWACPVLSSSFQDAQQFVREHARGPDGG
jgi:hypothetical protein